MKRNIILLTMVLSMMLLFSACSGTGDNVGTPTYKPYIGGQEAINFEFMPGMPSDVPGAISDNGNEFSIGVKLTNEGEFDVNGDTENDYLKLELKGIKPEYYGLTQDNLVIMLEDDLKGAKKNIDGTILQGDFMILSFDEMGYQSDIQGDLPVNFLVDLCYDYGTKSSTRICVADDVNKALTSEQDQQICKISATQTTQNSAGPIQVTNLRQSPMGGSKISVIFDIVRIGQGDIFLYESDNECNYDVGNSDRDKVKVVVSLPDQSTADLECSGFDQGTDGLENVLNVYRDGPATVNCKITGDENGDNIYLETLSIDLFYRYNEQISKSVIIKDVGTVN